MARLQVIGKLKLLGHWVLYCTNVPRLNARCTMGMGMPPGMNKAFWGFGLSGTAAILLHFFTYAPLLFVVGNLGLTVALALAGIQLYSVVLSSTGQQLDRADIQFPQELMDSLLCLKHIQEELAFTETKLRTILIHERHLENSSQNPSAYWPLADRISLWFLKRSFTGNVESEKKYARSLADGLLRFATLGNPDELLHALKNHRRRLQEDRSGTPQPALRRELDDRLSTIEESISELESYRAKRTAAVQRADEKAEKERQLDELFKKEFEPRSRLKHRAAVYDERGSTLAAMEAAQMENDLLQDIETGAFTPEQKAGLRSRVREKFRRFYGDPAGESSLQIYDDK
jgi:hypothetical protein